MTHIKRRAALKAFCGLAAAPLLPGCATAPARPAALGRGDHRALEAYLKELVAHELHAHDLAGLSLAVVDGPEILWTHGAGWADRERQLPATPSTLYRVGSISKLFTATAAMQLAAQGRLNLDAPLQQRVPEFAIQSRFAAAPITPRLLMTHHAGLPRDYLQGEWCERPEPFESVLAPLREQQLAYPPGLLMSYSNLGPTLLGIAVQRAAGRPFAEHLHRSLLAPLDMAGAGFTAGLLDHPAMAQPHDQGRRAPEPALRDLPAGGLCASVLDLSRFLMMVFDEGRARGQQLLPAAALREMLRPQHPEAALDLDTQMGLGWMLTDAAHQPPQVGPVIFHGGATPNFHAQLTALPRHRLGVAVASNDARSGAAVRAVAQKALQAALEFKTGLRWDEDEAAPVPAEAALPAPALAAYAGGYTTVAGYVPVRQDGRRLQARLQERRLELVPRADGYLYPRYALLGLIPLPLRALDRIGLQQRRLAGREVLVARVGGKQLLVGQRLQAPAAPDPGWRALFGTYEPVLAPQDQLMRKLIRQVQVFEQDGQLLARAHSEALGGEEGLIALKPLSDTEALALGPLADMGETVRRLELDGVPGFEIAGLRFRRVGT